MNSQVAEYSRCPTPNAHLTGTYREAAPNKLGVGHRVAG